MPFSRRRVLAALGSTALMPLVAGEAFGSSQSASDRTFVKLARGTVDQWMKFSPVWATQIGDHRFDDEIENVGAEGRNASLAFAKATLAALQLIDHTKLSRANQVDAALLSNALRFQIWSTETLQDWAWNPLYYQNIAGSAIYNLMAREFAPVKKRLAAATKRLGLIPALLKQARSELVPARVPAPHAETYSQQNKGLKSIIDEMIKPHLGSVSGETRKNLDSAIAVYNTAVDEHQKWIDKTLVPAAQGDFRSGAEIFDAQLAFTLQTNLTRAQIRERADAALLNVRAQMYQVAKLALVGRADAPAMPDQPSPQQLQSVIRAALDLAAADRPSRDRLVQSATDSVEAARAFVKSRDLITLPSGPVRVILMPEFQRGFSVAYCDSPGPMDKSLATFYAVSPIPDDWTDEQTTSFLREYNVRGITDIGVHEAMPGHYVQIYHSNTYPSVLRAILGSGSFIEGWAVYAEHLMVEQGFHADDPLYKLTQLKVRLRVICNAIIDQGIHCEGMTRDEVMKLLTESAFQEEREAAGKWRRAQLSVTQLSTYFVGSSEHLETRAEAERQQGKSFILKAYHDGILSFGSPPMRYVRQLYFGEVIT